MGAVLSALPSFSAPPPAPPSSLLAKEWRQMDWGGKETDLEFINKYKPKGSGQQQLRILLHGQVGVGKSSFINSVISVLEGKRCVKATVCSTGDTRSFTTEYKTYSIKKGNKGKMPLVLNDMMGMEVDRRQRRVHVKDVKNAMMGHIKDGYKFNTESALLNTDSFYKKNPTINDKVHVLVSVIDANTLHGLVSNVADTIQDIRDDAEDLGIPHVAIFTKIDEACPEIKKDIQNVFKSKYLQQKVQNFSKQTGIPENCIFPVKNYGSETQLDNNIDVLILSALRHIIEIGEEKCRK